MALYTRPMLVFEPLDYSVTFNPAIGTEPDSQGWTLDDTDNASISGGKLVITGGGADKTQYYDDLPSVAATGALFVKAEFKADISVTDAWLIVQSAELGVEYALQIEATQVTGNGDPVAVDMHTAEVTVELLLSATLARVTVDGHEMIAEDPTAYAGANELVAFGKGTVDDSGTQTWGRVQAVTAETYTFPYAPNAWNPHQYSTEKHVNITQNGTVDTIHYRDDVDISFRSVAHTLADVVTLMGLYTEYMAQGRVFYLLPNYADHGDGIYPVKMVEKRFAPTVSAASVHRMDVAWKLRVADDPEPIERYEEEDMVTLAVNDATPSVADGSSFTTANTSATTITGFDDARAGKIITVVFGDANTTIDSGITNTGLDATPGVGDVMAFIYADAWIQFAGTVGMA